MLLFLHSEKMVVCCGISTSVVATNYLFIYLFVSLGRITTVLVHVLIATAACCNCTRPENCEQQGKGLENYG